jgi:hypothetical protein
MFLPQGRLLTPTLALEIVGSDEDVLEHEGHPVSLYRCRDGKAYALGL